MMVIFLRIMCFISNRLYQIRWGGIDIVFSYNSRSSQRSRARLVVNHCCLVSVQNLGQSRFGRDSHNQPIAFACFLDNFLRYVFYLSVLGQMKLY